MGGSWRGVRAAAFGIRPAFGCVVADVSSAQLQTVGDLFLPNCEETSDKSFPAMVPTGPNFLRTARQKRCSTDTCTLCATGTRTLISTWSVYACLLCLHK